MVPRGRRTVKKTAPGETENNAAEAPASPERPEVLSPVIVDAGSRSQASVRRLKKGTGSLMREVSAVVHAVQSTSTQPVRGFVPIVVVYRAKRRSRSFFTSPLDFFL